MLVCLVDLLGLLKWQEVVNDHTQLKKHLEHLMRVDGEEIVKVDWVVLLFGLIATWHVDCIPKTGCLHVVCI